MRRDFDGQNGFVWWRGIVEDRNDPLLIGRVRVRIYGYHNSNRSEQPTDQLPWAYPMLPLDHRQNVVGPREGDQAFGFFSDGIEGQIPIIIGIHPKMPDKEANPEIGFSDARPDEILEGHQVPREPESVMLFQDGSGAIIEEQAVKSRYPDPKYLNESSAHRVQRNEKIAETVVQEKLDNIEIGQRGIPTANHLPGTGTDVISPAGSFSEPETPYAAKYPYNHVEAFESGSFREVDDTPGFERIHEYHRSGSFEEIYPNGTRVTKTVGKRVNIVLQSLWEHIEGFWLGTIDKGAKFFFNKDAELANNLDVTIGHNADFNVSVEGGKLNIHVKGKDLNLKVERDGNIEVDGNCNITVHGNTNLHTEGTMNHLVEGNYELHVKGSMNVLVDGDRNETIIGNHKEVVMQDHDTFSGGEIWRASAQTVNDFGVINCQRTGGVTVDDFAPLIHHTAPITHNVGIVTGQITNTPGEPGNRNDDGFGVNLAGAGSDAEPNINAEKKRVETLAALDAALALASATGFTPEGGSGGGSGSGSDEPSESVEGVSPGFLWKPVSESTGNLVVLLPPGQKGPVTITDANGNVHTGTFTGVANGGREHYRFPQAGSSYGQNATVTYGNVSVTIADGGSRYES